MALIKIMEMNNHPACSGYFYREGCKILPTQWNSDKSVKLAEAEIAEVPDKELDMHLATGKVIEVKKGEPINDAKLEEQEENIRLKARKEEIAARIEAGERELAFPVTAAKVREERRAAAHAAFKADANNAYIRE